MSLRTTSQNRASTFTFTNSRSGGSGGVGTGSVTITSIVVTDSGFNNLDDNAVGTSNSYIKIIGTGFSSSANVFVSGSQVSSVNVTYVNSTEIRVTLPSLSLGNTNIFVFNPDYSGAIWAPGITVSGFPDFTQTSYTSSTALEVSVQLLATGDAPLTYTLQAGSSLPSGCSLSSSGLITGTTTDGVYQFTVIVSDAQLQSFQFQITLTIQSTDAYFNRTVLAINADADTFVKDASSNSFAITINGDTKPSAFSPYNTNWSNYFDGTGDYLTLANNAALDPNTDSFCMECWVYITGTTGNNQGFNGKGVAGTSGYSFYITNALLLSFIWNGTGGATITGGTLSLNTWNHVAVVRNSGVIRLYLNGVGAGSSTECTTDINSNNGLFIGQARGGNPILGYMSNYRMTKGTLPSGYDATATTLPVPTTPLTAISGTSLLTCQSNRLIDNSTNAFTITKNGDVKVSAFGPFTETDTTTGSGYFDGTGDYLTIPYNSAWDFGTGNFTIETWLYPTTSGTARVIASSFINNGNDGWSWELTTGNLLTFYAESAFVVTSSLAISSNKWTHIAVSRSGSTLKLFVDGVESGTATYSTSIAGFSGLLAISATSTGVAPFVGYQSNFRLVKGTAVYTSAFTPPTTPLTAITNTSLLTLQGRRALNNHTFIDRSENSLVVTRGGNTSQGSFSPFSPAGWSNYFDGTGDNLQIAHNSALNFDGDMTVECWIYLNTTAGIQTVASKWQPGNESWIWQFSSTTMSFYFSGTASSFAWTPSTNIWYHIAISRSSGSVKFFVNGVQTGSTSTNNTVANTTSAMTIGNNIDGPQQYLTGYISNFRLVKGTAVYTSNFTPSTSTLTAIANTSLLTCQSNRFIDNSTNNFTITKNGDTKVVNFSPFAPTAAYSPETHGASAYFDGTGDYLTLASNVLPDISGVFTYECWIYPINGALAQIFGCWNNNTGGWALSVSNTTASFNGMSIIWYFGNYGTGEAARGVNSNAMITNAWNHIAVVRNASNVWAFYVNGIERGTTTFGVGSAAWSDSRNFTDGNPVGIGQSNATPAQCYISDARLVIGNAVYTANFTPPTAPLTKIGGTNLLLNFNSGGIIDSTSRNVLECVGGARIVTSTRKYGTGSMYFDGTDDRLTFPANSFFAFPGDFTIEFWSYNLDVSGSTQRGYLQISDTAGGLKTTYTSGIIIAQSISGGGNLGVNIMGTALNSSAGVIIANQWQHIAVTRASGVVKLFVDGTQVATSTISNSITGQNLVIGGYYNTTYLYNGYIDDLRITNGYARYTANFTAPTTTFLAQ
jgi:hypothetical protein